ncbi:NADPH-dependent FMN reductase [Podospora didyma]|uniref:NADPH-dependent FMN reductase n=1 Tax=Podospora didyma TaxID=330526 RepID=A0AAE0NNQ0_9PEZI|nr:NADPH-dependent FMN reductase [Podospora didyma]
MSAPTKSVAIVTMSTRAVRIGPAVTEIVKEIIAPEAAANSITLSDVDLATFKLPVFDEVTVPGMIPDRGSFALPHSLAWSAEIKRHDGYVLVIPEYNYGLAGGTKNAIDYLLHEWRGKPVVVLTYGIKGGEFASDQANHVLGMMKLRVAKTRPQLVLAAGAEGGTPDMFLAIAGQLGEASKESWLKEKSEEIKTAFAELRELLDQEPEEVKPHA